MAGAFSDRLSDFCEWIPLRSALSFPDEQIVYVVRVVGRNSVPLRIPRARKVDDAGIVNIGSGYGVTRLGNLKAALSLADKALWNGNKHHQLMLWWLHCDFDSLEGFLERPLEVAWRIMADSAPHGT
jgi:hypothetical protein